MRITLKFFVESYMYKNFNHYVTKLPVLMRELNNSKFRTRNELNDITCGGIYILYDPQSRKPVYVGRSDNIKQRVQRHSRPSSGHGSATFAFKLAKENAIRAGVNINIERKLLEQNETFKAKFKLAKLSVSNMLIKVVKEENSVLQTLFEVYAAIEMKTKYNDFSNH